MQLRAPGTGGVGNRKRVIGRRAARVERDAEGCTSTRRVQLVREGGTRRVQLVREGGGSDGRTEGGSEAAHVGQLCAVVAEPEPRRALGAEGQAELLAVDADDLPVWEEVREQEPDLREGRGVSN